MAQNGAKGLISDVEEVRTSGHNWKLRKMTVFFLDPFFLGFVLAVPTARGKEISRDATSPRPAHKYVLTDWDIQNIFVPKYF